MILELKPSLIHPCFTLKIGRQAYRCETSNIGQCFSFILQPLYLGHTVTKGLKYIASDRVQMIRELKTTRNCETIAEFPETCELLSIMDP